MRNLLLTAMLVLSTFAAAQERPDNLDFLRELDGEYFYELSGEQGIWMNEALRDLLKDDYYKFMINLEVQEPVKVLNDRYVYITGWAPASSDLEESAVIVYDLQEDILNAALLTDEGGTYKMYIPEGQDKPLPIIKDWMNGVRI